MEDHLEQVLDVRWAREDVALAGRLGGLRGYGGESTGHPEHPPGLEVPDADIVLQAITWYVDHNVDFIDACNTAWLRAREIETFYTFDHKHSSRLEGVEVRVPGEEIP